MKVQGFLLYRFYYGDCVVYVGRTKQPLQNRIRGHLFSKPMHRSIDISQVSKIEYVELKTEADMNLYEIYYILKEHPPLNVDDKTRDFQTVELRPLEWQEFRPPLWEKWTDELKKRSGEREKLLARYRAIPEDTRILRSVHRMGEIGEEEYWSRRDALAQELDDIRNRLWK